MWLSFAFRDTLGDSTALCARTARILYADSHLEFLKLKNYGLPMKIKSSRIFVGKALPYGRYPTR